MSTRLLDGFLPAVEVEHGSVDERKAPNQVATVENLTLTGGHSILSPRKRG
jgi:hypothetical protein